MAATEQANEFINQVLSEWTPMVIRALHQSISERKLLLTEDLYRSLRWEIVRASASNIAQANLFFRLHGRWRDMRTAYSYKQPPVDVILREFVEKLGAGKFRFVPGYSRMPTDTRALRRIAWGISRGILKRNRSAARKWYAKKFYSTINPLIEELLGKYQIVAADAVKNSINNG